MPKCIEDFTTFLQVSFIFSPEQKFNQFPRPPVVHSSLNCFLCLKQETTIFAILSFSRHHYEPVYYCLFVICRDSNNTLSLFKVALLGISSCFSVNFLRLEFLIISRSETRCLIFCKHQIKLSQVKFRIVRPSISSFICYRMD
jgi:hypothetical protein